MLIFQIIFLLDADVQSIKITDILLHLPLAEKNIFCLFILEKQYCKALEIVTKKILVNLFPVR